MKQDIAALYSLSFSPHEGWYRRVYNQAKALAEQGHRVTILAWDRLCTAPEEEEMEGFRVRRFRIPAGINAGPSNALNHLRFNAAAYRYLLRNPCHVVQAYHTTMLPVGLMVARRLRCKAVADICEPNNFLGFWPSRYNGLIRMLDWMEKRLARRFNLVFVHNTYQMRRFRDAGVDNVVQAGSYPDRSLVRAEPRRRRAGPLVFGRLGSVYRNNGYEELFSAFRAFLDRRRSAGDARSYRLRIAGHVFDAYAADFRALVAPLGAHVDVTGAYKVAELSSLYEQIDISLLFYGKAAFGNVTPTKLFESMACGVPVVVSDTGDMAEIVRSTGCGVVVDASDPASICAGLGQMADDSVRLEEMSANGIRAAREQYTWEAVRGSFIEPYERLLS